MRVEDLFEESFLIVSFCNVGQVELAAKFFGYPRAIVLGQVCYYDFRAFLDKFGRDALSESTTPTCDYCNLVFETTWHSENSTETMRRGLFKENAIGIVEDMRKRHANRVSRIVIAFIHSRRPAQLHFSVRG